MQARIGSPLREFLDYDGGAAACGAVRIEGGTIVDANPAAACRARGVQPGAARTTVDALGIPAQRCWLYSRSPDDGYYRARVVCFQADRVAIVIRRWMRE